MSDLCCSSRIRARHVLSTSDLCIRISDEVLGELAAVDGEQKRPWTRIKYNTQRRKYEVCSAAEAAAYPGTCTATATRCVSAAQRQQHILARAQPQARQGGCSTDRLIHCLLCLQWFCEHNNYNPNLAEPDLAEKVTNYMWWVSKNCPGYDYPKKPEEMVSPCHALSHCIQRLGVKVCL